MHTYAQHHRQSQPESGTLTRSRKPMAQGHGLHSILNLKHTLGNQAVQRLLRNKQLQTKIAGENYAGGTVAPPIVNDVLQAPGQSLPAETRSFMEARFGHDFSRVRIHTDDKAAKSAQAINAQAYTFGRDIAFGKGKYNPQTHEGKQLLAHELTHVVHQTTGGRFGIQRKAEETAPLAGTCPDNVPTKGCSPATFKEDFVKLSVKNACLEVRETDCIKDKRLRQQVLSKFDGLTIVCKDEKRADGVCAEATSPTSRTVNLFQTPGCPALLEMVIFHEAVHFTQKNLFLHSDLAWDCQKACYGDMDPRGKASACAFPTRFPIVGGISLGGAGASPTLKGGGHYVRLYAGLQNRRPILSFLDASLGIGVSFIGETTTGKIGDIPSGSSTLYTLLGALRFDPGQRGGVFFPVTGGIGLAHGSGKTTVGAEVGVGAGFHWYLFDVSLNAGMTYDPTRKAGMENLYTVSATLGFTL